MDFWNIPKIRLKPLLAVTAYLSLVIGLYVLLQSMNTTRAHVRSCTFTPSTSTFTITGENLGSDAVLSAVPCNDYYNNVVAKDFMWSMATDVKIKGSIAWVLYKDIGLVAIDISNPKIPRIVKTVHIDKFLWHLKIKGNTAYIACSKDGVVICDISSPEQARVIAAHKNANIATDVSPGEQFLYVSNGKQGFSIMDPRSGTTLRHFDLPGSILRIAVMQDRLFVFSKQGFKGKLFIYSLLDPGSPVLARKIELPGPTRDYSFKHNRLYLAHGSAGISILELDPQSLKKTIITNPKPNQGNRLAWLADNLVVFGQNGRIELYSCKNSGDIAFEGSLSTGSRILGGAVFDHYAITACNSAGITIVDLNDRSAAQNNFLITELSTQYGGVNWKVTSSGIAVQSGKDLYYLKYMPDGELKTTGHFTFPQVHTGHFDSPKAKSLKVYSITAYTHTPSVLYVCIKNSGLHVLKITPEGTLHQAGTYDIPLPQSCSVMSCRIHANRLYLCCSKGLVVFDISDPEHPVHLPNEHIPGNMRAIVFARGYAYITSYGEGIKICRLDARNNLGPARTIAFPEHLISGSKSLDIAYADGFIFAACGYRGLLSIDVTNPEVPIIQDSIELPEYCKSVQAQNGILCAESLDTLYLLDISNPRHMLMLGSMKNLRDFHLHAQGILQLQRQGIMQLPRPLILTRKKLSTKKMEFVLPEDATPGRYTLFINKGKNRCHKVGSIILSHDASGKHNWEFIAEPSEI